MPYDPRTMNTKPKVVPIGPAEVCDCCKEFGLPCPYERTLPCPREFKSGDAA